MFVKSRFQPSYYANGGVEPLRQTQLLYAQKSQCEWGGQRGKIPKCETDFALSQDSHPNSELSLRTNMGTSVQEMSIFDENQLFVN